MPAQVPRIGMPGARAFADRLDQAVGARELADRGGLAARDHQALDVGELLGGVAPRPAVAPDVGEDSRVLTEISLEREDAGLHDGQPR